MKTRKGFVSNSSSSSFIVAFDKMPKTIDEMIQMMFFGTVSGTIEYCGYELSHLEISQRVFNDMSEAPRITSKENMIKELNCGHHDEYPETEVDSILSELYKMSDEARQRLGKDYNDDPEHNRKRESIYDRLSEVRDVAATKLATQKMAEWKDKEILVFEYEDHSDWGIVMEYGDVFHRLPHIRVNKH